MMVPTSRRAGSNFKKLTGCEFDQMYSRTHGVPVSVGAGGSVHREVAAVAIHAHLDILSWFHFLSTTRNQRQAISLNKRCDHTCSSRKRRRKQFITDLPHCHAHKIIITGG